MLVASISGIRGIFNEDLLPADIIRFSRNFATLTDSRRMLVARDTRSTGQVMGKIISGALLWEGVDVQDCGTISTPAVFRESRLSGNPAIMITASHNELAWNGLKFLVRGRGIQSDELERILERKRAAPSERPPGSLRKVERFSYDRDLLQMHGDKSCEGVTVALDINGGAASRHVPSLLHRLGCHVTSLGDAPSIFNRTIDPTADDLELLRKVVVKRGAHIGLAFDCDGDRLVIVDNEGRKRGGDFMLALALKQLLQKRGENVVVSVDTTLAVREVVEESGGELFESKVGEANVLQLMTKKNARYGGEGSSGGLIDASFNNCRDSMVAAIAIIRALREKGTKVYNEVKSYHQTRIKLKIPRAKAERVVRRLQRDYPDSNTIDGVKIAPTKGSWVLVRPSGTENIIRISAEARASKESEELADSFLKKVKKLSA